jgi:para-aminobenzoate synthetase component 1
MIVDVARNDLSRIAKKGTVKVDKLFDIESFQQVHQMVSTVSCELKDDTTFDGIIKATFPMASMTGAPKIRAMELIDEYELYNRGPYSGALGYIDEKGNFDLNVLIRSIFYDEEKKFLSFTVGSAITALCNAEDELVYSTTNDLLITFLFLSDKFKIYWPLAKSEVENILSELTELICFTIFPCIS